jgi:hypothetical protein
MRAHRLQVASLSAVVEYHTTLICSLSDVRCCERCLFCNITMAAFDQIQEADREPFDSEGKDYVLIY